MILRYRYEIMLCRNQSSYLRATEIFADFLMEILKALVVKVFAENLYKCGKIFYNWSKPSLVEYKTRAELVLHYFAFSIGIESPLKFLIIYFKCRVRSKSLISLLVFLFLSLCLSSKSLKTALHLHACTTECCP